MNLHDSECLLIHVVRQWWPDDRDGKYYYTFWCGKQTVSNGAFSWGSFDAPTCLICVAKDRR